MPLPWNPNSPAKIGLEHENVGYAASRIAGPADWLALRFTALAADPVHALWLNVDAGASAPPLPLAPTNPAAGLRGPICVDMYRSGDEVQGDVTTDGYTPTGFETTGVILDETLSSMELDDVTVEGDDRFILSSNTVSTASFAFNGVTGLADNRQILDVRVIQWNRKSSRMYRVDDRFGVPPPGHTFFYTDRADGTSFVRSEILQGDGLVDWNSVGQWSRWTPGVVKEFTNAGKRRWKWRPLTAAQGRLDRIQFAVSHCLDRRIGHGIAQAPDDPYTWFRVPIWSPTASGSGVGPTLDVGASYVIVVRRMNPYVPMPAQNITAPLRWISHPGLPVNWELWTVKMALHQSPGRTVSLYKSAGLGTQVHGLLAAALAEDATDTLSDHTQPYTLARAVHVYNGRDALQYFTTPSTPGTHGMVYVTVSASDPAGKPTADLRVQVERVSDGAVVLGPAPLSVDTVERAPLVHDSRGEHQRIYHRAHVQFPATFAFAATTRYRIRFTSATPATNKWYIGALAYQSASPPYGLGTQSAGGTDEAQGEMVLGSVNATIGSDNILTFHHSTVDDTSAMDTAPGWIEGASTAIGRTNEQRLHGSWSVKATRLSTTGDAQFWHQDTPPYPAANGQSFRAVAWYRAKTTGRSCRVDLQFLDSAGGVLATATGATITDTTGGWTEAVVTGTAGASTARVRARYTALSAVAGEVHYVDQMGLYSGVTAVTWVAGATIRGDLQAVVAQLPAGPTNVTGVAKSLDVSPPDCLGHNHLQTEIVAGAYTDATTPDVAALDLTTGAAVLWYGALDHYKGQEQFVAGKWSGPSNKSYGLVFTPDGYLGWLHSTDGSTERLITSSLPHRFVDGQPWAVAAVFNGAAFTSLTFHVSYDKGASWVPLGTGTVISGGTSMFSGTAVASVGQAGDGTRPAPGRHYWARIINSASLTGTQVANPDFTAQAAGSTGFTDAAGRVWTVDTGALQAPVANCCCNDPSRIRTVPYIQLTWTATAHGGAFSRYVIQRNDDGFWRDVAYITSETGNVIWLDWSHRLGKQTCYRMRAELTNGQVSAWQPSTGLGMACVTPAVPATGLYLTSDVAPTYNTGYVDVYDDNAERTWSLLEYGDVDIHANHGVDKQVALHPIERRGDQFARDVILQAICDDDRYDLANPVASPPEEVVRVLRELTWFDGPYVVVRDHEGNRWYANVRVPALSARGDPLAWQANLQITETASVPTPVTLP